MPKPYLIYAPPVWSWKGLWAPRSTLAAWWRRPASCPSRLYPAGRSAPCSTCTPSPHGGRCLPPTAGPGCYRTRLGPLLLLVPGERWIVWVNHAGRLGLYDIRSPQDHVFCISGHIVQYNPYYPKCLQQWFHVWTNKNIQIQNWDIRIKEWWTESMKNELSVLFRLLRKLCYTTLATHRSIPNIKVTTNYHTYHLLPLALSQIFKLSHYKRS